MRSARRDLSRPGIELYAEQRGRTPSQLDRVCLAVIASMLPLVGRSTAGLARRAAAIERRAEACRALDDRELGAALDALRTDLAGGAFRRAPVDAALALLGEASRRLAGLQPYREQLMGALALIDGRFAEMQTGEGKTLVAGMVAAVAGLSGVATHVVTVNDYLARRDAELGRKLLTFAGVSLGVVLHEHSPEQRRAAYRCDVTYVCNKEVAFDFLRDRLALRSAGKAPGPAHDARLLPGLPFAIVDESDSILVDEARTPLILSADAGGPPDPATARLATAFAERLQVGVHFTLASGTKQVELTVNGSAAAASLALFGGIWKVRHAREELVRMALAACHLYRRDRDYVVVAGKVCIVDANSGRIAEGRSWQNGLQQMIEAIEGAAATPQHTTRTSITYQGFFNRYRRLAGLSGTLREIAAETWIVYGRHTVRIPVHVPCRRCDLGVQLVPTMHAKWDAVIASAAAIAATGRPILIGTRSVAASQIISQRLGVAGLPHQVLNALHDADEAAIVAQAGQSGRITVATSMAGRGTDIRLDERARRQGGMHVVLTELHESRRVDRQLMGRGARQGDPGTFETIVSLEDELFRTHAARWLGFAGALSRASGRLAPVAARLLRVRAQASAERQHRRERAQAIAAQAQSERALSFAGAD